MGGFFLEPPNFEAANPLKTPAHIAPVWYFTPFYAILRAVPDKLFGVILMFAAIVFLFLLPWLDRCKVRSIRYRGTIHKVNLTVFVISFVVLGYLGVKPATEIYTLFARIFTFLYFAFFILLWFYSKHEKTKPVPERITK
jgi:ubiquinol-cytochrome c reductase cytochrome b subunit